MIDVRVLVVHGDPSDLAVLASVAAAHEFELRVLESTATLIAETVRFQPDAVVLDVKQRTSDGYTLCATLKMDPASHGIPVILTGSLDGIEARRAAFAAGCDDFLEKPINRHMLAYRLRSFARLRRAWVRDAGRARGNDGLRQICGAFGSFLQVSPEERVALERAAVLRDIGVLVGTALPRLARVFQVLEVFDAVARDRTLAEALDALRLDAELGRLDPDLVTEFEAWFSQKQAHEVEP